MKEFSIVKTKIDNFKLNWQTSIFVRTDLSHYFFLLLILNKKILQFFQGENNVANLERNIVTDQVPHRVNDVRSLKLT